MIHSLRSSKNSDAGATLVTNRYSLARVHATYSSWRSVLLTSSRSESSDTVSIRSCKGIISSSQAITATARNSSPFARCIVAIDILPGDISTRVLLECTWSGFRAQGPISAELRKFGPSASWNYVVLLLGYGTMTGNQLPHAVLPNKRIGTEDSLDAVFAPDHCIISIGIGSDRGVVVVDSDFEIADLFTVHLIVGRV